MALTLTTSGGHVIGPLDIETAVALVLERFSGLTPDACIDTAVRRALYAFADQGAESAAHAADLAVAVARRALENRALS